MSAPERRVEITGGLGVYSFVVNFALCALVAVLVSVGSDIVRAIDRNTHATEMQTRVCAERRP